MLTRHFILKGLLAVIVMFSLTSCLVNEDKAPRIITRSTDTLRTLTGSEYYEYVVEAQVTSSASATPQVVNGTLTISYTAATLYEPFNTGNLIPGVFIEATSLTLGGTTYFANRYIKQAPDGSLIVLAANPTTSPYTTSTMYRATTTGGNTPQEITYFNSPVLSTGTIDIHYDYLQGCETLSACTGPVAFETDTITFLGDADITTNKGRFKALRLDYQGTVASTIATVFDIRSGCDTGNGTFFGSTYVFPEVGIVYMENSCTASDTSGHRFTASLRSTNVPIP